MSIKQFMPDRFRRVAKALGLTLFAGADAEGWHGLSTVLSARLTPQERAALSWAALRSLTPDQVAAVAETVLPDGVGAPIAPLVNHIEEAAFWADMAEPEALKAYCLASFNAMPAPRQAAFLDFVQGRQAA